jgi:hypothetical protein
MTSQRFSYVKSIGILAGILVEENWKITIQFYSWILIVTNMCAIVQTFISRPI